MEQNVKLSKTDEETLPDASCYRHLIGCLLYLTVTRPDITYSVQILSQFLDSPKQSHYHAAMQVLRYIKNSPGRGILLSSTNSTQLQAYCDSNWDGCSDSRHSVTS